jgi:hypothetical protein
MANYSGAQNRNKTGDHFHVVYGKGYYKLLSSSPFMKREINRATETCWIV